MVPHDSCTFLSCMHMFLCVLTFFHIPCLSGLIPLLYVQALALYLVLAFFDL